MEEQLISFETAKLAKEKGFDIATVSFYDGYIDNTPKLISKQLSKEPIINWNKDYKEGGHGVYYSAPTQSLLQKWLREKHNIIVEPIFMSSRDWNIIIHTVVNTSLSLLEENTAYEEALEAGLQEALKLI